MTTSPPPPTTKMDADFEEEIESLRAIYGEDAISVDGPRQITYSFSPNDVESTVSFRLPDTYPHGVPQQIDFGGCTPNQRSELATELVGLAHDAVGGVYLFELIEAVRNRLLPVIPLASVQPEEHAAFAQVLQANNDNTDHHTEMSEFDSLEIVLPPEILTDIFNQLSIKDLRNMAMVCRQWRSIAETNRHWQGALKVLLATTIGYTSFAPKTFPDFRMSFYYKLKRIQRFDEVDGVSPIIQLNYFERSKSGGETEFIQRSRVIKLKTIRRPRSQIKACPDGGYGPVITFGDFLSKPSTHYIVWTYDLVKLDCVSTANTNVGDRRFLFKVDGSIYHASLNSPNLFYPFDSRCAPTWEEVHTTTKI